MFVLSVCYAIAIVCCVTESPWNWNWIKKEVLQSKVILPWRWRRLDEYFGSFHFNSWFVLGDRVATLSVCWVNICVCVCFPRGIALRFVCEVKWEFLKFQYSCFVDKIESFIIEVHDSLVV